MGEFIEEFKEVGDGWGILYKEYEKLVAHKHGGNLSIGYITSETSPVRCRYCEEQLPLYVGEFLAIYKFSAELRVMPGPRKK